MSGATAESVGRAGHPPNASGQLHAGEVARVQREQSRGRRDVDRASRERGRRAGGSPSCGRACTEAPRGIVLPRRHRTVLRRLCTSRHGTHCCMASPRFHVPCLPSVRWAERDGSLPLPGLSPPAAEHHDGPSQESRAGRQARRKHGAADAINGARKNGLMWMHCLRNSILAAPDGPERSTSATTAHWLAARRERRRQPQR